MAKFEMDGEIKAKFTEGFEKLEEGFTTGCKKAGEKLSETFLDENGALDKQKVASTVSETVHRVERGVKSSAQKLSDTFLNEDGTLNADRVEASVNETARKVGRALSAGAGNAARFANRFLGRKSEEPAEAPEGEPEESVAPETTDETM